MMQFYRLVFLGVVVGLHLSGLDPAQGQKMTATVDSTESVISYTGSATMHNWTGTSRDVDGSLVLDLDQPDSSRVHVRVPVASFESGPDRRDRNMREVTEADRYPLVQFRATDIRPTQWGRSSDGYAGTWTVTGALTFHGQTHPVETDVEVRVDGQTVRAHGRFDVSLTRFGVERPSLLWIAPIGDTIRIDAQIVGNAVEQSALADRIKNEQSETTGTRRFVSTDLREITDIEYAGNSASYRPEFRADQEAGERSWIVSFYGFTDGPTGMATAQEVEIQADGRSVSPVRVEGTTRELDDGTTVEIQRAFFTRAGYETVAKATAVEVRIGAARFAVDWLPRRDMRRILEEVSPADSMDTTDRVSRLDDN